MEAIGLSAGGQRLVLAVKKMQSGDAEKVLKR